MNKNQEKNYSKSQRKRPTANPPVGTFSPQCLTSKTERVFFQALEETFGNYHLVQSKVRLCDVVKHSDHRDFNRIKSKHIDFMLYYKDSHKPRCAIELDDISHQDEIQKEHDMVKTYFLNKAGIPIVRYPVYPEYFKASLLNAVKNATANLEMEYPISHERLTILNENFVQEAIDFPENEPSTLTELSNERFRIAVRHITLMIAIGAISIVAIIIALMYFLSNLR